LLDGSRQELRPLRVRQSLQLGHLEHELFELRILIGDAALLQSQLIRRSRAGRLNRLFSLLGNTVEIETDPD
jgi:hypothetical protein